MNAILTEKGKKATANGTVTIVTKPINKTKENVELIDRVMKLSDSFRTVVELIHETNYDLWGNEYKIAILADLARDVDVKPF